MRLNCFAAIGMFFVSAVMPASAGVALPGSLEPETNASCDCSEEMPGATWIEETKEWKSCNSELLFRDPSKIKPGLRDEQTEGERVIVTIVELDARDDSSTLRGGEESVVATAILTALIPVAVDFGVEQISKAIKKEQAKYTQTWSGTDGSDHFFVSRELGSQIALRSIIIERFVRYRGETYRASYIKLDVEASRDSDFFRLVPACLRVDLAKAKIKGSDDTVDFKLDVVFKASYIKGGKNGKNGEVEVAETKAHPIEIGDIKLGQTYSGNAIHGSSTGWHPVITRYEVNEIKGLNHGVYSVDATVVESDEFGEVLGDLSKAFDDHKDDIATKLGEALLKALGEGEGEGESGEN